MAQQRMYQVFGGFISAYKYDDDGTLSQNLTALTTVELSQKDADEYARQVAFTDCPLQDGWCEHRWCLVSVSNLQIPESMVDLKARKR